MKSKLLCAYLPDEYDLIVAQLRRESALFLTLIGEKIKSICLVLEIWREKAR